MTFGLESSSLREYTTFLRTVEGSNQEAAFGAGLSDTFFSLAVEGSNWRLAIVLRYPPIRRLYVIFDYKGIGSMGWVEVSM